LIAIKSLALQILLKLSLADSPECLVDVNDELAGLLRTRGTLGMWWIG
jgi:hypothetical protein